MKQIFPEIEKAWKQERNESFAQPGMWGLDEELIAAEHLYRVGPGGTHCAGETLPLDTAVALSILGCSGMMPHKDLWGYQ